MYEGKAMKTNEISYKIIKRDYIIVNVVVGGACLFLFGFMLLQRYDILPTLPCIMHALLHIYCPGCGGTRALFSLLHGRILASLLYNPAVITGGLMILYYEVGVLLTLLRKDGRYYFTRSLKLVYAYLIMVVTFAVVRDYLLLVQHIDLIKDVASKFL